ncbi:carboxypeptidase regulatory-like domain-containing protein [Altibacter lentus]|uniref:carboxypeptidase regulatory-like domain-containing protein n=1 Tax=Altibacter lentus TaxID=1223410 RepID=UPI00054EA59A|nr:carboxypeptidase regulatory-like domain-containing protein [Altibacter lentus]
MKQLIVTLCVAFFCSFSGLAQDAIVKGRIVDTNSSEVIPDVEVRILGSIYNTMTDAEGLFTISGTDIPQGEQVLVVNKNGYITQRIPITVQNGATVNLDPILLEVDLTEVEAQIGIISLSDNELDQDEGTSFNISGLLQASNDVFLNAAAFDFSATFFNPRGLDNANGKVLINGIEMNKQFTGRPQWGNWGGLNDVQRNRVFSMGLKANDYAFGDVAGTTNIIMRASQYRQGGRVSYAMANRSYEGRVMGSYHSGLSVDGWAYSVLASRRFGDEGYQDGTLYDANSFFASVEKKINENHSLNFTGFYTPNRRGRSTAITQEARDLKGIRYNPNWGYQDGEIRNSRIREIEEPVLMLNHYWNLGENTTLNTNIGYQFGKVGNTRIDNGGTRLVTINGQNAYIGGARNPFGNYYQRLPSYFLRFENPSAYDYQLAYQAEQEFINDGQLDWESLYRANAIASANGGNSIYAIQNDRNDDTQLSVNSVLNTRISENITINGAVNYRNLKSENFAELKDLLGGTGYLDVDFFAEGESNEVVTDIAQSDLRNPNRIVKEGDRYKYNYDLNADVISGFAQAQFEYSIVDFYVAASAGQTSYQRVGLFENGNFPGAASFGPSEEVSFTDYGVKGGLTYKITGRHLLDFNAGYLTKAPNLRNTFSNARQNNDVVVGIETEKIQNVDASYIYRSPLVKARLTGYYNTIADQTDINFYFTESARGTEDGAAFLQEIITGIESRRIGAELGVEAQVTTTVKLKAAASVGQNVYTNNPNQYFTSEDFLGVNNVPGINNGQLIFGDGTTNLENYHVAGGPERAYQLGFEYRDPDFWWVGVTGNYFSNAYIDVSTLRRSAGFTTDFAGQPFNDYDEEIARTLLQQEEFDDYMLFNVVGGKSWKIKDYYVGFFATINNILGEEYITGGFEDSRNADYRSLLEESKRDTPVFGSRYFFGNGTTYYVNLYVRF